MRRHKKAPNFENSSQLSPHDLEDEDAPAITRKLPWESGEEYNRFMTYLLGAPRSVRGAYRRWCKAGGKEPKGNPPSTWFQLYQGKPLLIRNTERRVAAIEKAEEKHGRSVDWDAIEYIVRESVEAGKLAPAIYKGEFGDIMTEIKMIEVGFMSLEIDLNGDPIPGKLPWAETVPGPGGIEQKEEQSGKDQLQY